MSNGMFMRTRATSTSSGSSEDSNGMTSNHGTSTEDIESCMIVVGEVYCTDIECKISSTSKAIIPTRDEKIWNFITTNIIFLQNVEEQTGNEAKFTFNNDAIVNWKRNAKSTAECEKWVQNAAKVLECEIAKITVKTFPFIIGGDIIGKHKDIEAKTFSRHTWVVGYRETIRTIEECNARNSRESAACSSSQYTLTPNSTKFLFMKSWYGLSNFGSRYPGHKLTFDDKKCVITHCYKGDVATARDEIIALLKGITVIPMKVEKEKRKFLQKREVLQYINDNLKNDNLGKLFDLGKTEPDNLVVVAETQEKAIESVQGLSRYIKEKTYEQTQSGVDIFGIRFKKLQEQLPSRNKCVLYPVRSEDRGVKPNELHLLCIAKSFEEIDTCLQKHLLSGSCYTESFLYLPFDKYQYLKKVKPTTLLKQADILEVDIDVKKKVTCDDDEVCLVLHGSPEEITPMQKLITRDILQEVKSVSQRIKRLDQTEYLRGHGYSFCRTLGNELECYLHIKDENKDLQWQVCGKHVVLTCESDIEADASIEVKPITMDLGQKENHINADITESHDSTNSIVLLVPDKQGKDFTQQFEKNIVEVFNDLGRRRTRHAAVEIHDDYFTYQTEGDFISMLLNGLRIHTQDQRRSSLQEITFIIMDSDCLRTAKTVLEAFVCKHEDEGGYAEKWQPVVYITGPKKTVQNISIEKKIDEAMRNEKLSADDSEDTGQLPSDFSCRTSQDSTSVKDSCDCDMVQGYKLRKVDDSRIRVADAQIILSECPKSVGLISTGIEEGTCFQIGGRYIGTALHIVEKKLDALMEESWKKREKIFYDDVCVIFDYKNKNCRRLHTGFHLKYDPAYVCSDLDFVIMELVDGENLPPPPLLLSRSTSPSRFHSLGHPNGDDQTVDTNCEVIERTSDVIEKALSYVKKRYGSSKADSFSNELRSEEFFLCHSFSEFGSSGSPVFITEKGQPKVVGMLCKGTPGFFHDLPKSEQGEYPNHFMFEKVTKMQAIYSRMKEENYKMMAAVFGVQADTSMDTH